MWIGIEFGCGAHFESDVTFFIKPVQNKWTMTIISTSTST